ncbi:MAG: hypothetical protein QME81_20940, partial [bacterium]|nr:hypothetical protein [bacterium]
PGVETPGFITLLLCSIFEVTPRISVEPILLPIPGVETPGFITLLLCSIFEVTPRISVEPFIRAIRVPIYPSNPRRAITQQP